MAQNSSFCEVSLNNVPDSFSADNFYGFERYLFWHRINLINDKNRLSGLISNLWTNYGNVAPHAAIIHMYYLIFSSPLDQQQQTYCNKFEAILTILIILDNIHDIHGSGRLCTNHNKYNTHCFSSYNLFATLRERLQEYFKSYAPANIPQFPPQDNAEDFRKFIFDHILRSLDSCDKELVDTIIPENFYLIQDTTITGKFKEKINEKMPIKVNTVGTFMDPHSCSDCNTWVDDFHDFDHINIGLLYYQSYFRNLSFLQNGDIYFVSIYVDSVKKEEIPCKGYVLCISLNKISTHEDGNKTTSEIGKKRFEVDTSFFSVMKVCEVLTNVIGNDELSSDLYDFFYLHLKNNIGLSPQQAAIRAALLVVTIFILSKGFGDFVQGFEAKCLSLYNNGNPYWCNTFVTTVDTFFYLICILCAFPTIIGTVGGSWNRIVTFDNKKYFNKGVIASHNSNCKIKIDISLLQQIDNDDGKQLTLDSLRAFKIAEIPKATALAEMVETRINRYFENRKRIIDEILSELFKIHPIVIEVRDDPAGKWYLCIYALYITTGTVTNFVFTDASLLEHVDMREIYPSENNDRFKSLRMLANQLDIISVGELCTMLLFLHDQDKIEFYKDFLEKVKSTDIDASFVETKASKFIQPLSPNLICRMSQALIRSFFRTFRVALYELIRHLLIKLYTYIIDNEFNTNKIDVLAFFENSIYTRKLTARAQYIDTFSMCVDYITLSNQNDVFITCILIYHYNMMRITKIYKQINFLIDILEKILQNIKILRDIIIKLDEKIREITQVNEVKLEQANANYKAYKVHQSKEFIEQLRISYDNLFQQYIREAAGIETTLEEKINALIEILRGDDGAQNVKTQLHNANVNDAKLHEYIGNISRIKSIPISTIPFAKQGDARYSNQIRKKAEITISKSNTKIATLKTSGLDKKQIEKEIDKEKKKIAKANEEVAVAKAKERALNLLIRHIEKLYLVVTSAYKDDNINDIDFLEIVKNEFFKFMRKHIRAPDNIKWFKNIKESITILSKIPKDIKSLRLDFDSLQHRFNGIFKSGNPVEGSQMANHDIDLLNEANPEMNVCSSVCDNAINCSECANEQGCLPDNEAKKLKIEDDTKISADAADVESNAFKAYITRSKSEEGLPNNANIAIEVLESSVYVNLHDQYGVQPQDPQQYMLGEQSGIPVGDQAGILGTKRKADYKPTTGGNKKNIYKKNKPKTSPNTKPKTAPATKPKTAPATEPKTAPTTKPKTAPATKPKTAPATKPKTAPATKPKTVPTTKPKTAPTTKPKTAPTTKPKTAPTTKPKTAPTTKPKTAPTTKPKTAPTTKPKTAPTTKPKTAPTTKPKTAPTTKPKTAPTTKPKTAPTTKPKTAPTTKPKTAPTTKPKTAPTTKPKTAPTTKPKTAPTTKPKTAPVTKPKTTPTTKPKTSPTNKPK